MDVHVSLQGPGTLSRRVYRQLFGAVLDGRLRPGERLPATRELARQLEVSRNTVALAYDQLVAEGILVGRAGAGTFVCTDPVGRMHARHAPGGATLKPGPLWKSIPEPQAILSSPPVYDFRPGSPDARLFPFTVLAPTRVSTASADCIRVGPLL